MWFFLHLFEILNEEDMVKKNEFDENGFYTRRAVVYDIYL